MKDGGEENIERKAFRVAAGFRKRKLSGALGLPSTTRRLRQVRFRTREHAAPLRPRRAAGKVARLLPHERLREVEIGKNGCGNAKAPCCGFSVMAAPPIVMRAKSKSASSCRTISSAETFFQFSRDNTLKEGLDP